MIKTEADLAKLTARQREVLMAVVRQLSKDKVARLSQLAGVDAEALLQAYAIVQETLSKSAPSISPALASLAEEWQELAPDEKAKKPSEPSSHC